jgi:sugar phosphate isomerase/epimerase
MAVRTLSRRSAIKRALVATAGAPLLSGISFAAEKTSHAVSNDPKRTGGLKLGLASVSLKKLPVEKLIEALHEVDLDCVALQRPHIPWDGTADECGAVAKKFKDAGINVTGSGVIDLPNNEARLRKAFDNARAAGLPTMTCKPALDALTLVEKFVKEYDIRLAIHNHGPEDKVYPSPYDAWKVIQPYDKRIGLCIDVGHTYRTGTDPVEAIRKCRDRLYDIHLKDSLAQAGAEDVPVEIGRGKLDIRGILAALIEIKYPHIVGFEYEKESGNPVVGLAESVGFVRGMLAKG